MPSAAPSPPVAVFRHVPHETLGRLAPALRRRGLDVRDIQAWRPGAVFPSVSDVRALVVMGGPMGVYEQSRHPFLTREIEFIRGAVAADKPVLGICLGSQLIAAALGARVYPNADKEIGWYPLAAEPAAGDDFLFSGWPAASIIFQWHGDTFDLPAGAAHLFSSPLCRHQAFRFGKNVYGLQFHPEVDDAMIRDWLGQPDADRELAPFGAGKREQIERDTRSHLEDLSRRTEAVFDNFARLCAGGPPSRGEGLVTAGRF